MMVHLRSLALVWPIVACLLVRPANADCAPFSESLDSPTAITSNGGTVAGSLNFSPAVNADGAVFNGAASITYTDALFGSPNGSLSLWFKKNSNDNAGGIAQIGYLGQPNSIGLFYNGQTGVYLELRNNAGGFAAAGAPGVLARNDWCHIVAVWQNLGSACNMWLFVNGRYVAYQYLPGSFVNNASQLQLGVTGYYGTAEGVMDEVRFFDWCISDDEVYAEYVYSANRYQRQPTGKPVSTGAVQVVGPDLFVDGCPFTVKGVGYQPMPIGSNISRAALDFIYTDPDIIARDMALLRDMNVNTIRTWSEVPDNTLLDACYNGGLDPIYVIMGFWVPMDVDYSDPATIASIKSDFQAYVNQFKDHPAVLAWGIGNENNLAYAGDVSDWFTLANELALVAYQSEGASYHPSMVINGGLLSMGDLDVNSDDASLNYVDVWGTNAYFGQHPHCYFDYYQALSAKPLILTEFGIDAWDQQSGSTYESVQAQYVVNQWRHIRSNAVGGTIMAYTDEWWKAGDPNFQDFGGYGTRFHPDGFSNEEWWGLLAVTDNGSSPDLLTPRQAYYDLGAEYATGLNDADADGDTDLKDFSYWQRCFQAAPTGSCGPAFDVVVNGLVDLDDLQRFTTDLDGPVGCDN